GVTTQCARTVKVVGTAPSETVVQPAVDGDAFVVDDAARYGGEQVRRPVDVHHRRVRRTRAVLANNWGCRDTLSSSTATSIPESSVCPDPRILGGNSLFSCLFSGIAAAIRPRS